MTVAAARAAARDGEDLEALFERVAAQAAANAVASAPKVAAPTSAAPQEPYDVFKRIGELTRGVHDALRELGYDKALQDAVDSLPDARDRLDYIATLTGKAAERALSAAEIGKEVQDAVGSEARRLGADWDKVFAGDISVERFKALAGETRAFITQLPERSAAAGAQFTEIMLAQDFHDLTGQVIQRIVTMARNLESQLVQLLIETTPPERRTAAEESWLSGPVVNSEGRNDVVTSQAQVDDLLESLGF